MLFSFWRNCRWRPNLIKIQVSRVLRATSTSRENLVWLDKSSE
jgi:hypothetical protein